MFARPRIRSLFTMALTSGALCGLVLLGSACDKGGSNSPEDGGGTKDGGTTKPVADGGKDYVYPAEGFKLMATTTVKLEIASTQGQGTAELSARSLIETKPAGDKLEVHGKVVELIGYTGTGQLDPEFMKKQATEAGEEPMDLMVELAKSEGWSIVDRKGQADTVATKALPQNQTESEGAGTDFGLFGLPDLPRVDLEVGKKVQLPTKADERQLPFGSIPVEIDTTWTLRAVNGNIAELDVSSEASGATEFDGGQGTATVSMLEESSYTIMYDLTTKLPISLEGYSASEINVDASGQEIKFATNNEVKTTYEVAP